MKDILIKVIAVSTIVMLIGTLPIYSYESYNAVTTNTGIDATRGTIKVTSPYINATELNGHKDYIVYVYGWDRDTNYGSIGAGWIAWKTIDSNTGTTVIKKTSLVYISDSRYPSAIHNITLDVSSQTSIEVYISQGSSSNCWIAATYGQTYNWCFASSITTAQVAGSAGGSKELYTAGVSDMPGLFDQLQYSRQNESSYRYFSDSATTGYKCNNDGGYVLDMLAKYSNNQYGSPIDKVGTGPRTYYTDDCKINQDAWSPFRKGV